MFRDNWKSIQTPNGNTFKKCYFQRNIADNFFRRGGKFLFAISCFTTDTNEEVRGQLNGKIEIYKPSAINNFNSINKIFSINFSLLRNGMCVLHSYNDSFEEKELSFQAFSFLKDTLHRHRHHHAKTDKIIDLTDHREGGWIEKSLYSMMRKYVYISSQKDIVSLENAKGILSYINALQNISNYTIYDTENIQKSLNVEANIIKHQLSMIRWLLSIAFASVFGILTFSANTILAGCKFLSNECASKTFFKWAAFDTVNFVGITSAAFFVSAFLVIIFGGIYPIQRWRIYRNIYRYFAWLEKRVMILVFTLLIICLFILMSIPFWVTSN